MVSTEILNYLKKNTEFFQIMHYNNEVLQLDINRNQMKNSISKKSNYYEVIVYTKSSDFIKNSKNNILKKSSINTKNLELNSNENLYRRAVKSFVNLNVEKIKELIDYSKNSNDLNYFYGLPDISKYKKINYDKLILDIDKMNNYMKLIKYNAKDNFISDASIKSSISSARLINSNNIDYNEKSSSFYSYIDLLGKKTTSSEYIDLDKSPDDFQIIDMCSTAKKKLDDFECAKKLNLKSKNIILNQDVFSSLLDYTLIPNFSGYLIENKRSFLSFDKIEKSVFQNNINIIDDPFYPASPYNESFDSEGNSCYQKNIIEKGIFKNPLTDFNLSKKYNLNNTASSSGLSSVDFSNIVIEGDSTDYDNAILIDSVLGAHTSNSITTDFSVNVSKAYYIKKDKRIPVNGFFISGNMLNVLNYAKFSGSFLRRGNLVSKDLVSDKINVIKE